MNVDEGLAYVWDKAEWNGNRALTADELSTAFGMKSGELATGPRLDAGMKELTRAYSRKGYITGYARESVVFDDATHRVTFRFNVQEGAQYHMGNLTINGLTPELTDNLKQSWTLASGAVYDAGYVQDFGMNALPRFIGTQMQRSQAFRLMADTTIKPDRQKL